MPPISKATDEFGRHQLPFRPNEHFVLDSVMTEPGHLENNSVVINYRLGGQRRKFELTGKGETDGYVTDLGRVLENEVDGVESPVMDERVIRLDSGEEITVIGNTVSNGQVRLKNRKKDNKAEMATPRKPSDHFGS